MKTDISYSTLPNGLRTVAIHRPDATVEHCGVAIDAGSRDETPETYGLAHFVEHTIFKGTTHRRAWHILNRMELVGGELNAFTTKEETTVYSTYPAGNTPRALELIADLVAESQFPAAEIDKEREVVADEIDTYLDMPSEAIFDDFDELAFAGSPLAHPILGTRQTLEGLDSATCRRFIDTRYTPGRMVLFYSGALSREKFHSLALRYFGGLDRNDLPSGRQTPPAVAPFDIVRTIGTHQAHTIMGARIDGLHSPNRYAMNLLTNILGGPGMNSLLNLHLRERKGLVYTIDASLTRLTDCGLFAVYFGCDPKDTRRCADTVARIIAGLAETPLTDRQLRQAKTQYLGQLTVSSVNTEQTALSAAHSTLQRGTATTIEEVSREIMALTPEEIRTAAASLNLNRLTLC